MAMDANTIKNTPTETVDVLRLEDLSPAAIKTLLAKYELSLELIGVDSDIPGSYWGDEEAGLIGQRILARADTPVHSILHETCHYVCMDDARRSGLNTDAGGDYAEENAVCYLQILLAEHIRGCDRQRMFNDMDTWGYTFRLGCAKAWFEDDAEDAMAWLLERRLINRVQQPLWQVRRD